MYNKKLQMVTSNMLYNSITYKIQCFTEEPHHSEVQFEKVGLWVVSGALSVTQRGENLFRNIILTTQIIFVHHEPLC